MDWAFDDVDAGLVLFSGDFLPAVVEGCCMRCL